MDWTAQAQTVGEVALAMLLGGVIGVERELADKPAGFRTHMLVAGAAALLVGLGDALIHRFDASGMGDNLRSDPIRIVEAIITGISFLGAGTIFRRTDQKEHVEGLTTAASILMSSAIGISVALRQFVMAVGVTLLALLTLRGFKFIQNWIDGLRQKKS
ncbi:MAG TPA: MgtC/SapB family protein [Pyrinomonadaceae bacterium]|jgi:putative Mg2+ transporter-C (MgtC) family protein